MSEGKTLMLVLITGKPNSGKTAIINALKSEYKVFIVDEYIKTIYLKDEVGYLAIKNSFGSGYVNEIAVDRKALGELVYGNPEMLTKLAVVTWPLIKNKLLELKKTGKNIIIEMAIFLVDHENIFEHIFDKVIEVKGSFQTENPKQKYISYYKIMANKKIDLIIHNKNLHTCIEILKSYFKEINFKLVDDLTLD